MTAPLATPATDTPTRGADGRRGRAATRTILTPLLVVATLAMLAAAGATRPAGAATPVYAIRATQPCAPITLRLDDIPASANPFDPSELFVNATFVAEDETTFFILPAYFTRDFTSELVDGREVVTPAEPEAGHWEVRVTLPTAGTWSWFTVTYADNSQHTTTVDRDPITCAPDPASGAAANHGFLRVSDTDPHHMAFDDGTPYVAIGENLAWPDERGTFAYDAWLDELAARHVNFIRVWMPSWAFGLETIERDDEGNVVSSSLGNYRSRLDRVWQLDQVIEAARTRGIVVMLTLQNHGPFSLAANSEWADNPYNAANGGPLTTPEQFFTDAVAQDYFQRRVRYIVARYAYATNVIWEQWNEVDLTQAPVDDIVYAHNLTSGSLRSWDPYARPITTSIAAATDFVSPEPAFAKLWEDPSVDLVQVHLYGVGDDVPVDFTDTVIPNLPAIRARYGKPVLLAEAGVDFRGPSETLAADPTSQGIHELQWSGLFGGGFGSGMSWWWDSVVDPEDLYPQFDGLHALTAGLDPAAEHLAPPPDRPAARAFDGAGGELDAFPLIGDRTSLVWVRNPANWWHQPDHHEIGGARLELDLAPGSYDVTWLDPVTGATRATSAAIRTTATGRLTLSVPAFPGEVAARVVRTGDATAPAPVPAIPVVTPAFTG